MERVNQRLDLIEQRLQRIESTLYGGAEPLEWKVDRCSELHVLDQEVVEEAIKRQIKKAVQEEMGNFTVEMNAIAGFKRKKNSQ